MNIYAGDMIVNHEIGNIIDHAREIRQSLKTIGKYGVTIDSPIVTKIVDGSLDSIADVLKHVGDKDN